MRSRNKRSFVAKMERQRDRGPQIEQQVTLLRQRMQEFGNIWFPAVPPRWRRHNSRTAYRTLPAVVDSMC